jgi:hypothetical protein
MDLSPWWPDLGPLWPDLGREGVWRASCRGSHSASPVRGRAMEVMAQVGEEAVEARGREGGGRGEEGVRLGEDQCEGGCRVWTR